MGEAVKEPEPIRFYIARGEHGYFSNLHRCAVEVDGVAFASAEHAYQYAKPKALAVREWIRAAPLPRLAASAGHHLPVYDIVEGWDGPSDKPWEGSKVRRMEVVVEAKFRQNPGAGGDAPGTGDARLIEESLDGFWGEGRFGNGLNMLGHMLVGVRTRLRAEGM